MRGAAGRAVVAAAAAALVVTALAGCGDDEPTWGTVSRGTCTDLDVARAVADAFPDAGPPTRSEAKEEGGQGPGASMITCSTWLEVRSGRLAVVVEISSSATPGRNSLYALRDDTELALAGAIVDGDTEDVDGW
jgi:hypothetical protein